MRVTKEDYLSLRLPVAEGALGDAQYAYGHEAVMPNANIAGCPDLLLLPSR